ncbi:non-structural protein NSm [Orthotospovirus impatiensnecromaculae]|uniref:Non-structural protein n=4 Tax=Orthotospovirus impatiensnecromaculae TaxID=3052576 RepID=W0I7B6_INSV|nr:non-structural protein [Impatiens necrotic spot virus]ARB49928.1 nonstructural movement protein [Impatiens necrotic spot virus]QAU55682.1 Non-structural movement protein [Orthotospovirus impatiensnecromaculae]QVX32648.1 non-structural protein NSm [Orthotospovirus impatiensnecromaculae]
MNSLFKSLRSSSSRELDHPRVATTLSKQGADIVVHNPSANHNNKEVLQRAMDSSKGKILMNNTGTSSLGTYESDQISESESYDLSARMIVDTNHHISSWKNDLFVGNGDKAATKIIKIHPTWDSRKQYMMISRIVIWICPTIADPDGKLAVALIDPNKSVNARTVLKGQGSIKDPICFVFYLNWSIPKVNNTSENCVQLHLLCDQVYKKDVSFASVMYSWTKEFCDSPRADLDKSCMIIPINRAIRAKSQAFIEACKLIIPKGNSEKQIRRQLAELSANLEKSVEEEENVTDNKIEISFDNEI